MIGGIFRKSLVLGLVTLLAACGGPETTPNFDDTGGTTGDGGTSGGTGILPSITLTVIDPVTGLASNQVSQTSALQIRVQVGNGTLAGQLIRITNSIGVVSPASTGLTDDTGLATFTLSAGDVAGAGSITARATIDDVDVEATTNVQSDGGEVEGGLVLVANLVVTTVDGSLTIARANPGTATVTVTDVQGTPVPNALVSFETGFDTGIDPESGAVLTNAAGIAQAAMFTDTTFGGAASISALVRLGDSSVRTDSVNYVLTGDGTATVDLDSNLGNVSINIDNATPALLTATVTDYRNNPVEGILVNFRLAGGFPRVGELSATSALTDALGQATVTLLAGTIPGVGEIEVDADVPQGRFTRAADNFDNPLTFTTEGDGPFDGTGTSNLSIALTMDTDGDDATEETSIDADTPGTLIATVRDAQGNLLDDIVVEFSSTISDLFPPNGQVRTVNGRAEAALTAGSVPGAGTARATILIDNQRFNQAELIFDTLGNGGDTEIVLNLVLTDATPTNNTNIITASEPATLVVTVEDPSGTNLPNRSVTLTTTQGTLTIGTNTSTTLNAVSNSQGRITATLNAGADVNVTGNVIVTAGTTSEAVQFNVGVDGLQIGLCSPSPLDCSVAGSTLNQGALLIGLTPLAAGGTSSVQLVVVDASLNAVPDIEIAFSSDCSVELDPVSGNPLASITQNATSNANGVVSATYEADGCVDVDPIVATEANTGAEARGDITVQAPELGSIVAIGVFDATETTEITSIGVQGSGGNQTAIVIFQVFDELGDTVADQEVSFTLTTGVGGVTLQKEDGLTDAQGRVRAIVQSGFFPTPVVIEAGIDTDGDMVADISSQSSALSVNTGLADQNSMSMSASTLNMEGEGIDGNTTSITVRLADAFNNPVPDRTTVQFLTEYGSIAPSCETTNGACSVTLTTSEPRRPSDPNTSVNTSSNAADMCPDTLIRDEAVTIAGDAGDTDYRVETVHRVELAATSQAISTSQYTVDEDGITCTFGAADCVDTANVRITYTRAWMDEQGGVAGHPINTPGVATAPFRSRGFPCQSISREATDEAPAYFGGLGQLYGGRSTILAFTQGEETFIDANGDGRYSFGETFVDLAEAFVDHNEDGVFGNSSGIAADGTNAVRDNTFNECYGPSSPVTNPGETLDRCFQEGGDEEVPLDFNVNGILDAGNGIYNGTLCPLEVSQRTDTCDNDADPCDEATERYCTRSLVNIRRSLPIIFAGTGAAISFRDSSTGEYIDVVDISGGGPGFGLFSGGSPFQNNGVAAGATYSIGHADTEVAPGIGETTSLTTGNSGVIVDISDLFNGVLPSGTVVSVASGTDGCVIQNSPGTTIGNTSGHGFTQIFISLTRPTSPVTGGAPITVTVTPPSGLQSSRSFSCFY